MEKLKKGNKKLKASEGLFSRFKPNQVVKVRNSSVSSGFIETMVPQFSR